MSVKHSKYNDNDDNDVLGISTAPALSSEAQAIARWTADLNDILARANAPMLNFLGALSVRLRLPDVRYTMAWNSAEPDPRERVKHLVQPASTVREWITLNRDVGETLLSSYLESVAGVAEKEHEHGVRVKKEERFQAQIGMREHDACFDLRDLDEDDGHGVHRANDLRNAQNHRGGPNPAQAPPAPPAPTPSAAEIDRARSQLNAAMRALHQYEVQARRDRERRGRQRRGPLDAEQEARDDDAGADDIVHHKYLVNSVEEARTRLSTLEVQAVGIDTGDGELVAAQRRVREAHSVWMAARKAYDDAPQPSELQRDAITAAAEALSIERQTLQTLQDGVARDEARSHVAQARELLKAASTEMAFAPAWAWECMGSAVWRRFVSVDALAAIQMAHSQVNRIKGCERFSVKELVCSHEVHDQFAFLVAYNYLSTSDTQPGRKDSAAKQGNGTMTYMNIEHLRRMLSSKVLTCHVWFETHVQRRTNPLLSAFDRKKAAMIAARPELAHDQRWLNAMQRYRAMMPSHELVCVEPYGE